MAKATIYVPSSADDAIIQVSQFDPERRVMIAYGEVVNGGELEYDDSLPPLEGPMVKDWIAPLESPPAPDETPAEPTPFTAPAAESISDKLDAALPDEGAK